jgi:D-aminopeptidase
MFPRNFFIITDLEGVAGVTRFEQVKVNNPEIAMARAELTPGIINRSKNNS